MGNQTDLSILLGNGFNIAFNKSSNAPVRAMDYSTVLSLVKKKIKDNEGDDSRLIRYLNQGENNMVNDIERLLNILDITPETLEIIDKIYTNKIEPYPDVCDDRKKLKRIVVEVLTSKEFHPDYNDIFNRSTKNQIKNCGENIKKFSRIYTVNYDLVLYWLLARENLLKRDGVEESGTFRDGFSIKSNLNLEAPENVSKYLNEISTTNNLMNLIYLHGALHLIRHNEFAYKIKKLKDDPTKLQGIRKFLLKDKSYFDSLIVFDATNIKKLDNISSNNYLLKSYDKLKTSKGTFIIYGCKLPLQDNNSNDMHLWRRLLNSKIKKLYIGCNETDKTQKFADELSIKLMNERHSRSKLKIFVYSHEQINIWENNDFYNEITNNSIQGIIRKP